MSFFWGFCCELDQETTAFSVFPLLVADSRSGYVFVLVLSFGDFRFIWVFFLICCCLSSDCLEYIHDGGCESWGMRRLSVSC